ncbi:MAG: cation:proton antiporter [Bacteroidales bacterium]
MTGAIIITLCILLLLSYVFDITASKTKLPSVILLLVLGLVMRKVVDTLSISMPNLAPVLPLLGTIGLILIVLEGSLELEFNKSKFPLIAKSSLVALLSIVVLSISFATAFFYFTHLPFRSCLINALPLSIISSAIAIPTSRNLSVENREFIIYESSLSDIFGVILFNFIIYNDSLGINAVGHFFIQIVLIAFLSFIVTVGLLLLLRKLNHHVRYTPIILLIILVYAVSKELHLPALLFILVLGLFFANFEKLAHFNAIQKLHPDVLKIEIKRFKELTVEMTFLIRSLFFLLFGFMIETSKLFDLGSFLWSLGIIVAIYGSRWVLLKIFKLSIQPLLFIVPRGLITILLFLSIPAEHVVFIVKDSLVIQVIIFTALLMMFGMFGLKRSMSV